MVELKGFNWDHIDTHYKWNNDEVLNFNDSDYPLEYESYESFSKRIRLLASPENVSNTILEIHHIDDNKLIGVVDIHGIDPVNKRCFVEATIGDVNYRNKGYGRQAFNLAISYCFQELEVHKVCTSAFDFNRKWITIVKRMGFRQEGQLREHTLKNGAYCDKLIFGLLKSEFAENPAAMPKSTEKRTRRTG
jgi:RimJ/RimL family protein N-acetyltransferase